MSDENIDIKLTNDMTTEADLSGEKVAPVKKDEGDKAAKTKSQKDDESMAQLKEAIKDQAIEEEKPQSSNLSLRKILGGEFLSAQMLKNQIWLIILVVAITLVYVSNRYSCQKDIIEITQLKDSLKDAKYKALASSSELTEMSRESNVLEMLKNNKDSVLHIASQPPYIIKVPEK